MSSFYAQPAVSAADRIAPGIDYSLYPSRWSQYIGQTAAKQSLEVAVKSAKKRGKRMDHILIAHPSPGVGKTALAALVAKERGTTCRVVTGTFTADQARILLSTMKDGDVVFIDEIHRLVEGGRKNAEWMLTWLFEGRIEGPRGMEQQPDVTVIGATTDPQKLPPAIINRFPLRPMLLDYSLEEATKIAQLTAKTLLVEVGLKPLGAADARLIAGAADCNPRTIRNLLINLRDLTLVKRLKMKGARYDVEGMLRFQGITIDGLTMDAQRYLISLSEDFHGKGGMRNLQDMLQIPGGLNEVETVLMKRGFIAKTGTGRQLTQQGIRRYNELKEAA